MISCGTDAALIGKSHEGNFWGNRNDRDMGYVDENICQNIKLYI